MQYKKARVMHDDWHDYYEEPNIQNMSAEINKIQEKYSSIVLITYKLLVYFVTLLTIVIRHMFHYISP